MGKRVLITGAASGLGKALALRWASSGADICVADVNASRGAEVVEKLSKLGVNSFYQHCDITSDADVEQAVNAVVEHFGGIDVLINNAGVASAGALQEEPLEQWQWVMNVNVFGAVRVLQAFLPLLQQSRGYVLNVASQAGITTVPLLGSYAASKAAMVSFSETMRLELMDDHIGVSVLCPGFFKTNLDESLRSGNPGMKSVVTKLLNRATISAEEVADKAYLAVQQQQFLILTHPEGKRVNLLKRIMPGLYLRVMEKHTRKFRSNGRQPQ